MGKTKKNNGNTDWKSQLALVIQTNESFSLRGRSLRHTTQRVRAKGLQRIFKLLRDAGYSVGPFSLGGNHIEFLVHYWTADARAQETLSAHHSRLPMLKEPYSPSYIQQQLSFLRVLCIWIGKRGLVLPAHRYVSDPALVSRATGAMRDRTWYGPDADRNALLGRVIEYDAVVGLQLEVLLAFGLPRRQAVVFCPALAVVPVEALPLGAGTGDYLAFVQPIRGTPGTRVRLTPVRSDEQRDVLERARAAAPVPSMHIGYMRLDLKQNLARFNNVLFRCGVSLRRLDMTAHSKRYEFPDDIFFKLRKLPAPRKGNSHGNDQAIMQAVHIEAARRIER